MAQESTQEGYKKIVASNLPKVEQDRLRNVLQQELMEAMIKTMRAESLEVDLSQIEVVLRPGQSVEEWDVVANCSTCDTCGTCSTCETCSTASLAPDIPLGVARELGLERPRAQIDLIRLQKNIESLSTTIAAMAKGGQ